MNETIPPGTGIKEVLDSLGIRAGILLAGLAGGLVSLQYIKTLSRPLAFTALFSSLTLAAYGTPALMDLLHVTKQSYCYGSAFIVGLCALRIIPVLRELAPAVTRWLITRFTGQSVQPTQGDGGDK